MASYILKFVVLQSLVWSESLDPLSPFDDDFVDSFNGDANAIPSAINISDWDTDSAPITVDPLQQIASAHRMIRTASKTPEIERALRRTESFVEEFLREIAAEKNCKPFRRQENC